MREERREKDKERRRERERERERREREEVGEEKEKEKGKLQRTIRNRQTDRQTKTEAERKTKREKEAETERHRGRERHRDTDRDREGQKGRRESLLSVCSCKQTKAFLIRQLQLKALTHKHGPSQYCPHSQSFQQCQHTTNTVHQTLDTITLHTLSLTQPPVHKHHSASECLSAATSVIHWYANNQHKNPA